MEIKPAKLMPFPTVSSSDLLTAGISYQIKLVLPLQSQKSYQHYSRINVLKTSL